MTPLKTLFSIILKVFIFRLFWPPRDLPAAEQFIDESVLKVAARMLA
jgi:hypothetical protein